jgi:hypothetical protein
VILALTLLLPAVAQGEEDRAQALTGFELRASNGYRFLVVGQVPTETVEGQIDVFLTRGKHTMVVYLTSATMSPTSIDADLGKLGRISVTRVPIGRTKMVHWGCKPGSMKRVEAERYEGTIEFHGEEGFTEVSETSAPVVYPWVCVRAVRGAPDKVPPGAHLDVEKRLPRKGYRLGFDAIQSRAGAETEVSVEVEERRGEMAIFRSTRIWASTSALSYDRSLHTATVRPPAPFAGHGSFHGNARGANQWTGNLTVDLPGRPDVPVTGPGFWAADLEHY